MDTLLQQVGITGGELTQLLILIVVLVAGLALLRLAFKLTAALLRVGCFIALLIVGGFFLFSLLNSA